MKKTIAYLMLAFMATTFISATPDNPLSRPKGNPSNRVALTCDYYFDNYSKSDAVVRIDNGMSNIYYNSFAPSDGDTGFINYDDADPLDIYVIISNFTSTGLDKITIFEAGVVVDGASITGNGVYHFVLYTSTIASIGISIQ